MINNQEISALPGKEELILFPLPIADSDIKHTWIDQQLEAYLKSVKLIFAENERTARRFISSLRLGIRLEEYRIERMDKNTRPEDIEKYIRLLQEEKVALLMSEAGCPAVADPGSALVDACHQNQIRVTPLIGPSSIILSLMASGLNGQSFTFHGYLPVDKNTCSQQIRKLDQESRRENRTQILIETPYRNAALWSNLLSNLSPETRLCYAKNISSNNQEIRQMKVSDWKKMPAAEWEKVPVIFLFQNGNLD